MTVAPLLTLDLTGSGAYAGLPLTAASVRKFNSRIGERGYTGLIWEVMVGYTGRLVTGL